MKAPASLVAAEQLEIRSFRVVFSLERRLFRVDQWRVPLPYGVPVIGIVYAVGALIAILIADGLPGIGLLVSAIPPPIRLVVVPVGIAALLTRVKVDGRPAHRFAVAFACHRLGPRTLDAFAAAPAAGSTHRILDPIVLAASARDPRPRPGIIRGPAVVTVAVAARAVQRGSQLHVTPTGIRPLRRGKQITLAEGQSLVIGAAQAGAR